MIRFEKVRPWPGTPCDVCGTSPIRYQLAPLSRPLTSQIYFCAECYTRSTSTIQQAKRDLERREKAKASA